MKKIELTVAERIVITEKAMEFFKNYQENHSQQTTPTPVDIVVNIVNNVDVIGKSVVVVANFDVFIYMQYLNQKFDLGITDLQLVTDVKLNFTSDKIIYVDSFKEIKLNKKFDVAILNPPYVNGNNTILGYQVFKQIQKHVATGAVILPKQLIDRYNTNNQFNIHKTLDAQNYFINIPNMNIRTFFWNKSIECSYKINELPLPEFSLLSINTPGSRKPILKTQLNNLTPGDYVYHQSHTNVITFNDNTLFEIAQPFNINTYRVFHSDRSEPGKLGKLKIAKPGEYINHFFSCFSVQSENDAVRLIEYLNSELVTEIITKVKPARKLSKSVVKYIPMPDFLK
jgi:hypothetical protein